MKNILVLGSNGADHTIDAFSKLAVETGVQKLVLLSGRGGPEAVRCEQAVIQSGADHTIIRSSWFMQNFTESYMAETHPSHTE